MSNHPNRNSNAANSRAANPTPEIIRAQREVFGHTQTQAAAMLYSGVRKWQKWEAGDDRMHPALFELYLIKGASNGRK